MQCIDEKLQTQARLVSGSLGPPRWSAPSVTTLKVPGERSSLHIFVPDRNTGGVTSFFPLFRGKGLKTGPGRGIGYGERQAGRKRGGEGREGWESPVLLVLRMHVVVLQDGRLMTGWWPMEAGLACAHTGRSGLFFELHVVYLQLCRIACRRNGRTGSRVNERNGTCVPLGCLWWLTPWIG